MRYPLMIKTTILTLSLCLSLLSSVAFSEENADTAKVTQTLTQAFSGIGLKIERVNPSPVDGLYEVITDSMILYSTKDGEYFFMGNLAKMIPGGGAVDLTAAIKKNAVKDKIEALKDEMIIYPAKNEKYVITVFTDTTCGYCHKLHQEMQGYNDLGITVRYLAFPRSGERSSNLNEMASIWCAPNTAEAMNQSEKGTFDPKMNVGTRSKEQCKALIMNHFNTGVFAGVTGTPGIILEDGTEASGYRNPSDMLKLIQSARSR